MRRTRTYEKTVGTWVVNVVKLVVVGAGVEENEPEVKAAEVAAVVWAAAADVCAGLDSWDVVAGVDEVVGVAEVDSAVVV